MNTHRKSFAIKLTLTCVFVLLAALILAACKSDSQSVVSKSQAEQSAANPSSSPTAAPASTSPTIVPTAPVGPVGQTTSSGQPTQTPRIQPIESKEEKEVVLGKVPTTLSPAKPPMTSAPDPFPARPTPTIVMENGKIKQQWPAPAEAASQTSPVKDQANAAQLGREFYMQKCVDCHGKEGKGNGWMAKMVTKPPTNLASEMVQANSDGELFWKITNGRSPMPAHRVRFTDEQRWYIVAFLRTFKP